MTRCDTDELRYKRSRFTARLPMDRLYAPSHFWLKQDHDGAWRVGFTRFAKRMLGDIVEFDFEQPPGSSVQVGQVIGWVEAFKAVADLYCAAEGIFLGANAKIQADPALIDSDPHGEGWLYRVRGEPDKQCVDAQGYAAILDAHIDKMLGETP
jgi:glycine cleavage system H protein